MRRDPSRPGLSRLLLLAALLASCLGAASAQFFAPPETLVNQKAPEFILRDMNGASIDLASLRGKVVLLNFWATWCGPCEVEMPIFASWQSEYGRQGLQVIGISMDDDPALARKLYAKLKLNYQAAMGNEKLGELYGGVLGLPLSFVIDRDGIIRARYQGEAEPETILSQLKKQLNQH